VTAPKITNRTPSEGDLDISPEKLLGLTISDLESRVDVTTAYLGLTFAQAVYAPVSSTSDLPTIDGVVNSGSSRAVLSVFNDASGATLPKEPADLSIDNIGTEESPKYALAVERTVEGQQEGFIYIHDKVESACITGAEVLLSFTDGLYSVGETDYFNDPTFTGVMFGFVHWIRKTGVFLFFRDDAGTRSIAISGPAEDGYGDRSSTISYVPFDWLSEDFSYKIVFDATPYRNLVQVFVGVGDAQTLLYESTIDGLGVFLDSVRLGGVQLDDNPELVSLVAGTDGSSAADIVSMTDMALYRYGKALLARGYATSVADVSVSSTSASMISGGTSIPISWSAVSSNVGDLEVSSGGDGTLFNLTNTVVGETLAISRSEPLLSNKEWVIFGHLYGQDSVHAGSYNSGMGMDISDGTSVQRLRFIDTFSEKKIGLFSGSSADSLGNDDNYALVDVDWAEDRFWFSLIASESRSFTQLTVGSDTSSPSVTTTYSSDVASSEASVSMGFIDSDILYNGKFYVYSMCILPYCSMFTAVDSDLSPDDSSWGWTRTQAGSPTTSVSGGLATIDSSATSGSMDFYSVNDDTYSDSSGATMYFRMAVHSWTDGVGSENPPKQVVGPLLSIRTEDGNSVQVYFTQSDDGDSYLFIPYTDDDMYEVLSRTDRGISISTKTEPGEERTFILSVTPRKHIRLYADYDLTNPLIDLSWSTERESAAMLIPAGLPEHVFGFGVGRPDHGAKVTFNFVYASLGRGHDFELSPLFSEDVLSNHIYGSKASVIIEVEDKD